MQRILLSQNKWALVDDEDFDLCGLHNWYYASNGYAMTNIIVNKKRTGTCLHIVIGERIGLTRGFIDHEDRDKLNCQRSNLREATPSQNNANHPVSCINQLGVKGVIRHKSGRFRATINVNKKQIHLGYYAFLDEAKQAYREAAKHYYGEFANAGD